MIVFIAGGTHTGKTLAAQKLLEKYHYPYLSIDHLKMGLIRSGICPLSPESDDGELTAYLWNIVKEIVKTALENRQNLVVEGCVTFRLTGKRILTGRPWNRSDTSASSSARNTSAAATGTSVNTPTSSNGAWTTAIARRKCCLKRTGPSAPVPGARVPLPPD